MPAMNAARSPRWGVVNVKSPFIPVTAPPRVVPVSALSRASSAFAKLIVAAPPAGVARFVMALRMLVSERGSLAPAVVE